MPKGIRTPDFLLRRIEQAAVETNDSAEWIYVKLVDARFPEISFRELRCKVNELRSCSVFSLHQLPHSGGRPHRVQLPELELLRGISSQHPYAPDAVVARLFNGAVGEVCFLVLVHFSSNLMGRLTLTSFCCRFRIFLASVLLLIFIF